MYFKQHYSHYIKSADGEQLFFTTNFKDIDPKEVGLIFNYGLVCSIEHWKYQLPFFDSKGIPIIIHDYRGHFNSSYDGGLASVNFENMAHDLKAILDFSGMKKAIFIGHSMGVNVTLEFAKRYPKMTKGMILISGSVLPPQDVMFDSNIVDLVAPHVKKLAGNYPALYQAIWSFGHLNPFVRYFVKQGGFNVNKTTDEFVHIYLKKMGELPNELFFHLLEEMKNHTIINYLDSIKTPTLIIGGDQDKIIPNYLQNMLHELIENSELYIVKDGSHVPQVDFPQFINERIERFLAKVLHPAD